MVLYSNSLSFRALKNSDNSFIANYSADNISFSTGTWYHIAAVREGSNFFIFRNGISLALTSSTPLGTNSIDNYTKDFEIGRYYAYPASYHVNGVIDEFRWSKGTARWTTNFTPYSSAYGRAANSSGQGKIGSGSAEFKGGGEYLSAPHSEDWYFNGDFTVDFWARYNSLPRTVRAFRSSARQLMVIISGTLMPTSRRGIFILNMT